MSGDLDAMGLGEQHPKQLLGEIRVDAGLDRLLPAGDDDIAHPRWLDDRCIGPRFHRGNLTAHCETLGDDRDQRAVELIDAGTEIIEIDHRVHRTRSTAL